jgi:hypothetical protein
MYWLLVVVIPEASFRVDWAIPQGSSYSYTSSIEIRKLTSRPWLSRHLNDAGRSDKLLAFLALLTHVFFLPPNSFPPTEARPPPPSNLHVPASTRIPWPVASDSHWIRCSRRPLRRALRVRPGSRWCRLSVGVEPRWRRWGVRLDTVEARPANLKSWIMWSENCNWFAVSFSHFYCLQSA